MKKNNTGEAPQSARTRLLEELATIERICQGTLLRRTKVCGRPWLQVCARPSSSARSLLRVEPARKRSSRAQRRLEGTSPGDHSGNPRLQANPEDVCAVGNATLAMQSSHVSHVTDETAAGYARAKSKTRCVDVRNVSHEHPGGAPPGVRGAPARDVPQVGEEALAPNSLHHISRPRALIPRAPRRRPKLPCDSNPKSSSATPAG
jgi:hypothetical protein